MIESPRSTKGNAVPNNTAKFARKDLASPNTTINNNNIIININKSYNMKGSEEGGEGDKEDLREAFTKEDELNESKMK